MPEQPSSQPKKRRVKNPETFRERALKAADAGGKPKRARRVLQAGGKAAGPVARPVAKIAKTIFDRQPFRLIGRLIWPKYFRSSLRELRLVKWPNWQQSRRLTTAVLIFALIFGASIALVDWGLDKVFKQLLLK